MTEEEESNADLVSIAPAPHRGVFSFSVLGAAIGTGLAATLAMLFLPSPLSWQVAVGLSLVGGITAGVLAGVPRREGEAALLRERAAREEERKSWGAAVVDLESLRRQINLATLALRGRKDPLVEVPELRVGALHDLLEASRDTGVTGPVVSRIAVDEAELVGNMDRIPGFLEGASLEGFDPHPPHPSHAVHPAPAPSPAPTPAHAAAMAAPLVGMDPRVQREALRTVDELIQALEQLGEEIESTDTSASAPAAPASGSPAQLVDSVVQTAANGIEDLAAGLMRANELATVAERVTNRATLLALNAQLEATRTGGEAMGAIAEETRRLSEYGREATDTISRLAEEIEAKMGETITAIHAASEDAKAGIASLSAGASPVPAKLDVSRAIEAVVAALDKAYDLRAKLESVGAGSGAAVAGATDPAAMAPASASASEHGDFLQSGGASYAASLAAHVAPAAPPPAAAPSPSSAGADAPQAAEAEVTWGEPAWADAIDDLTPEQRAILERLQPELKRDSERQG